MDRTDSVMASFIQELMRRAVQDALNTPEPHSKTASGTDAANTGHAAK